MGMWIDFSFPSLSLLLSERQDYDAKLRCLSLLKETFTTFSGREKEETETAYSLLVALGTLVQKRPDWFFSVLVNQCLLTTGPWRLGRYQNGELSQPARRHSWMWSVSGCQSGGSSRRCSEATCVVIDEKYLFFVLSLFHKKKPSLASKIQKKSCMSWNLFFICIHIFAREGIRTK